MNTTQAVIDVNNLVVNYDKTAALWDLTFSILPGQIVGVIGPNGAGKSSLLKALLGFVKPLSGRVLFNGKPFKYMRKKVAYVPQKGEIDWDFPIRVIDVVLMGRYVHLKGLKWYRKADKVAAYQILKYLEMDHLAKRQVGELSIGQQQRLFIARALMQESDIFLLDEPFAGVDKVTEQLIMSVFKKLKSKGKTLLIVHHELATVKEYFDSTLILNTSLVAYGPTKDVCVPKYLNTAFSQTHLLFDEALKLSQKKTAGLS